MAASEEKGRGRVRPETGCIFDTFFLRYFHGTKVVARTIKPIQKGQEVAENYGPIYTTSPLEERRKTLRNQYWFECGCEACSDFWPLFDDMDPGEMRFRCQQDDCNNVIAVPAASATSFMAQCLLCHRYSNVLKGLKALQVTSPCPALQFFKVAFSSF